MQSSELDYDLPSAAIATTPAEPRDSARLLVDRGADAAPSHRRVSDLPDLVGEGDVIVVNDTRVRPCRVPFRRRGGGAGEVLLLEERSDGWHEALVRPSAKLAVGETVEVVAGVTIEFGEPLADATRAVRVIADRPLDRVLDDIGDLPLPPYLGDTVLADPARYQTIFARRAASAAAPTAGLHFTPELTDAIVATGAEIHPIELVVGLDTFRPVRGQNVEDHPIHSEEYRVPTDTWEAVGAARRVVAVGTTSVRALESAAASGELAGRTRLFILPGYRWHVVDALLTNFHLPRTTLLAMIEAFVGPRWRDIYGTALGSGYRFLSFGDAMFAERTAVPARP